MNPPRKFFPTLFTAIFTAAIVFLSTLLTARAETLTWDPATAIEEVVGYNIFTSVNGGSWTAVRVTNSTSYTLPTLTPGVTYRFYLTAINESGIEGSASTTLTYWKPIPPPPVNIVDRTYTAYDPSIRTWSGYRVIWTPVDLATYRATNYWLTVETASGASNQTINAGTNVSYTFPTLALGDYTFRVSITNAAGGSPAGTVFVQSSRPPGNPRGFILKP
jgi:hypothetical protein